MFLLEGVVYGADVINAVVAISASLIGTFGGIITSAKITTFRIRELEKKSGKTQ